jgi:hypothetical protein
MSMGRAGGGKTERLLVAENNRVLLEVSAARYPYEPRGEYPCWCFHLRGEVVSSVLAPEDSWSPSLVDFVASVPELGRGASTSWVSSEVEVELEAFRPKLVAGDPDDDIQLRVTFEGGAPMEWKIVAEFEIPEGGWNAAMVQVARLADLSLAM